MNTNEWAYRLGQQGGRVWRYFLRRDRQAAQWLTRQGVSAEIAKVLLWFAKIVVIVALVYLVFWLMLLLTLIVAATWFAQRADWEKGSRREWKDGLLGFGLYDENGFRIDPHDPDELH